MCVVVFFLNFSQKSKISLIFISANEVICILKLYLKAQSFRFILVSILLFYDEKNLRYEQFTTCTPFKTVGHFVFGGHLENGGISSG